MTITDVRLARPGAEGTYQEEHGMVSSSGNDITFDALPSWLNHTYDRITFPQYSNASTRQKNWAFTNDAGILS